MVDAHYLLEYLNNKFGYKHLDVVEKLLSYFENKSDTIIGSEIQKTQELLDGVFNKGNFWGRQVLGDDDIFWEYKGQQV